MKRNATRSDARYSKRGAITLRGLEPALLRRIDDLARAEGLSRSRAALRLLKAGAGIGPSAKRREIGGALDRFIGTWSASEESALRRATAGFRAIDEDLWR